MLCEAFSIEYRQTEEEWILDFRTQNQMTQSLVLVRRPTISHGRSQLFLSSYCASFDGPLGLPPFLLIY